MCFVVMFDSQILTPFSIDFGRICSLKIIPISMIYKKTFVCEIFIPIFGIQGKKIASQILSNLLLILLWLLVRKAEDFRLHQSFLVCLN